MFTQLTKVIELLLSEEEEAILESISLVENPAVEIDFLYFDGVKKMKFKIEDEDERIIVGVAMLPEMRIPRVDKETGEVYAVYFSKETVAKAAELFLKLDKASKQNTDHLDNFTKDLYLMESWIREFKEDKCVGFGFESVPIGTWLVKMRVLSDEIWAQVKDGTFKGLSVQGDFVLKEPHYESIEFSRFDYKHIYDGLETDKEKAQMDQIIRLLIIDGKK